MSLRIHLIDRVPEADIDHQQVKKAVTSFLKKFRLSDPEVGIHLVSADYIRRINQSYRKNSHPTDVISFPIDEPLKKGGTKDEVTILGDIFISPEMVEGDLIEVIKHGLTHLLGYDHKTREEEKEFQQICSTKN